MKKEILSAALVLFSFGLFAQKTDGIVNGVLKDAGTSQLLNGATVSLMSSKDSALITYTLSTSKGYFEIKNVDTGSYHLLISYQGFQTLKKAFSITSAVSEIKLDTIKLQQDFTTMGEVIVTSETPIKVKGDTISYRGDSFKTLPNATVEDLLKKLPGIEVDKEGAVKVQGEDVPKIYVDGKEFFGNDPKMATKNLTADMVDQIETYNDMSDQAKFSGIDDGSRSRVINIKLKKDKKKGVFGRASAGYGNDGRYEGNMNASFFKAATRVTLIARANNTNNMGFTNTDMLGMSGGNTGGGGRGGGGNGLTSNWNSGVNYTDIWGKKMEIAGSYFYNHSSNVNVRNSYRQTFGKDTTYRTQTSSSAFNNDNHRLNLRMTYQIDSTSSIVFSPNINTQRSESLSSSSTDQSKKALANTFKVNENISDRNSAGSGINWSNNITYRKKLSRSGRNFSISLSNSYNNNDRDGYTVSSLRKFRNGESTPYETTLLKRNNIQRGNSTNYSASLSYVEPLGKGKVLEFNYGFNKSKNESDREVFDMNDLSGKYDIKNITQSNLFENSNTSNRLGTNYRVVKTKYNYQIGLSAQNITLISNNLSKDTVVEQTFTNLFPNASFNYQFARSKNLRFEYRGRTDQPSIAQLQPLLDSSSSQLYWSQGNPFLKQEYSNNFSINYNSFNNTNYRNFFVRLNFSNTFNRISNNVIALNDTLGFAGPQLTTPVNTNGAYNVNGNINFGLPLNKMRKGNFNTSTSVGYSRGISMRNWQKNYIKNLNIGENLRLSYNHKDKLDLGINARVNFNSVKYTDTTRSRSTNNQNTAYYNYSYSVDASYIFPHNFILSTDVDYRTSSGLATGYNQQYMLWNANVAKQLFKNKRGELKFSVFDILKQNRSIDRNFSDNYIEDVQSSVLQRFFLLSFTYRLNRMGGRNINAQGGNRIQRTEGQRGNEGRSGGDGGGGFGGGRRN